MVREKTRYKTEHDEVFHFEDEELRTTLEEYMREENKNGTNFWNFSTITGLAMVFVATTVMVQIFLNSTFGLNPGPDLTGLMNILPVLGGGLIALVGFGAIASEKKKKTKKKSESGNKSYYSEEDPLDAFLYPDGKKSEKEKSAGSESKSGKKKYSSSGFDSYAMSQKKKLFKSRTDKKITGVCGGLASYFGISSTMVRLIFAITTILGYGSMALIYIALSIALPKEPVDLLDDF